MKQESALLLLLGLVLVGCESAEQAVQQKTNAVVADATNAAKQQVDPTGEKQRAIVAAQEAQAMLTKISNGGILDPEVKVWIEKTLADSSQVIRAIALPVVTKAWNDLPKHREWLESEAKKAASKGDAAAKQAWMDLIDNWNRLQSVAESQK
jgi:hypothetical protein